MDRTERIAALNDQLRRDHSYGKVVMHRNIHSSVNQRKIPAETIFYIDAVSLKSLAFGRAGSIPAGATIAWDDVPIRRRAATVT
ncbi:hypothetical protein [Magnetospirillum sp. 15-1]|uniref:hypothetical protein n=1 Tax=Magnetospirillum sp. 15-1 TaxID=1979370 RepID=UPI001142D00E|nr:hypothetical protein [Magnetospirillum sp. 15-1]